MEIKTEIKQVTPVWADMVLKSANIDNRSMRQGWVKTLAGVIKRGEWQLTHQGIAFDTDGILIDGQHRLAAIVMSGQTVPVSVTTGLERKAFGAIDVHAKRSIGDLTRLPRKTAEVCRFAALLLYGEHQPSATQVSEIGNSGLAAISNELIDFCGTSRYVITAVPIRLTVCILANKYPSKKMNLFEAYRRMVLCDYLNMTPIEAAVSRRISTNQEHATGGNASSRLLAIASKLFDEKNKNISKVYVTEEDILMAKKEAVAHLSEMVNKFNGANT